MSVDVIIEDERWASVGLEVLSEVALREVVQHLGLHRDVSVAVMGCDDRRIATLNADFRGKPVPTNVLSWPSVDRRAGRVGQEPDKPLGAEELGDIAIAFETTEKEAVSGGLSLKDHATHLIVHGLLHLLGYDHETDADGDLMESIETAILARLGIADPYSSGPGWPDVDGKD